jgi:hypothetical protein
MEREEFIAIQTFAGLAEFGTFEDAAKGFVMAAANGPGYYPDRLKKLLGEKPVMTAEQFCARIDNVQALPKPGLKKKHPAHKYHRFAYEMVRPGIFNFFWVCGPRPPLDGEAKSSSRTVVSLNSGTMAVSVVSHRKLSVDHRIKAAKGEWSPFAHKRATGKV